MGSILLSWVNWLDASVATATASSEVATLRVNRLYDPQIRRRWRTQAGVTSAYIDVDLGSAKQVGVLALVQPDDAGGVDADRNALGWMTSTDTVRHRLDASTPGGGSLLDTGVQAGNWQEGYGAHIKVLSSPVNARYWRADIDAPSLVSLGYIDIGRAWIGPSWRPDKTNIDFGWGWVDEDAGVVTTSSRSGLEFVDHGPRRRTFTFSISALTEADAIGPMREMQRVAGITGQVLVCIDPEAGLGSEIMVGRLRQVNPITQPNFAMYETVFQIQESL